MNCARVARELIRVAKELAALTSVVEDPSDAVRMSGGLRNKINRDLNRLLETIYFDHVPINDIFAVLERHGVVPIQEDYTRWSGILAGRDGTARIDLALDGRLVSNAMLNVSYHKMQETGNYEVTSYVS